MVVTYSTSEWSYMFYSKRDTLWISRLKDAIKHFKIHKKPLNQGSLNTWVCNNLRLYKSNLLCETRQEIFDDFYNSYLFLIEKDKYKWKLKLETISDYFDKYNKKPPSNSSHYIWLKSQQKKKSICEKNNRYFHNSESMEIIWNLFCSTYDNYVE